MWHKGVRWHHVESDIMKEGPWTETSWRWGIVEHKYLVLKCCLKQMPKEWRNHRQFFSKHRVVQYGDYYRQLHLS